MWKHSFKKLRIIKKKHNLNKSKLNLLLLKKRPRSEGTSQQVPQAFDNEPPWVGQMFDRMSLMESNFNSRMDTMESNFNVRFTQMDENLAHLQYNVHHIYEQ